MSFKDKGIDLLLAFQQNRKIKSVGEGSGTQAYEAKK